MRRLLLIPMLALLGAATTPTHYRDDCAKPGADRELTAGCAALDRFLAAFNARDAVTWSKTLHYPHVRLAGGEVRV